MKVRTTAVWLSMLFAGLVGVSMVELSVAQMPQAAPEQAVKIPETPTSTPAVPAGPTVTQDGRPEQLAVCKKVQTPLEEAAVEEMRKLMTHVIANDIFFSGAPYVLFQLGPDGKLTGAWMSCVAIRHLDGLPAARPKEPYYETTIPALLGVAATCPKAAPSPAACKGALADYLSAKGLIAIGLPRIADKGSGTAETSSIWVPYGVKP